MSPEAQRIAIGQACGWTQDERNGYWIRPSRKHNATLDDTVPASWMPDYLNDLGAIHGAFDCMTLDQRRWFCNHLRQICGNDGAIFATAAEHAKAFLKTVGKWQG